MEVHDHTDIVVAVLVLTHNLLVVGFDQEGQGHTVGAQGRLHHIRNKALALLLVEIGHVFAGGGLVLGQVVVGTVGHAPQLAPTEGEQELKVRGGLGVEAQLLGVVVTETQIFLLYIEAQQPVAAEASPILEPLQIGAGLAEELQLHLLKFPGPEGEVAGGNLVAEGFAHLAHAEGQLAAGGTDNVLEINKNALGCLRTQIHGVLSVLGDTLEGLEHQIKLTDIGKIMLAAGGAGNIVGFDEVFHLCLGEGVDGLFQRHIVFRRPVLNELVGAEALLALLAVHERIGKAAQMAGGHPRLGVHQNGGIQAHVIGVLLDELLPPCLLDVVFQLHTQGAVIPGVGQAAVDLGTREHKAAALAQGNDLLHGLFGVFQHFQSLRNTAEERHLATMTRPAGDITVPLYPLTPDCQPKAVVSLLIFGSLWYICS